MHEFWVKSAPERNSVCTKAQKAAGKENPAKSKAKRAPKNPYTFKIYQTHTHPNIYMLYIFEQMEKKPQSQSRQRGRWPQSTGGPQC